jgi:thiamine biosynthesis lipoprotein ApbE
MPPTSPPARDALEEADRLEELLSVFRESSAISQINRAAGTDAVEVAEEVFDLLTRCSDLSLATGGAFDITSTPSVVHGVSSGARDGCHRMTRSPPPARSSGFDT